MKKILSIICSLFIVFSLIFMTQVGVASTPPLEGKYSNLEQYPQMLKDYYKKRMGRELNLENPKLYSEKVQWLKLYDAIPIKTKLIDKYLVKDWVKEKIGQKYVVPLFGVYDKFDDIDFDKLPNKFVLKVNNGTLAKEVIIVQDKNKFDKVDAKKKFDKWLNRKTFDFRLNYYNIKPKIIAEQYIEGNPLYEFKVYCFNGKPKYVFYFYGMVGDRTGAYYDTKWNFQPFYSYTVSNNIPLEKPSNLNEILTISEKLSQGFSHVRVDFYVLSDGTLKFGEMTFTPGAGSSIWPKGHDEAEKLFGDLITLPKEKYDYRKIFESAGVDLLVKNKLSAVEKDAGKPGVNKPGKTKKDADKLSSKTLDNGIYTISSKLNSNKCLAIKDGSKNNCANLQLLDRNGTDAQKFKVKYNSDGCYTIKAMCSEKMLDMLGGSKNILQCTKNKRNTQKWFIVPDGEGFYCLVSKSNDLCMSVDDANVCCLGVHGGDSQRFKLEKCEDNPGNSKKSA